MLARIRDTERAKSAGWDSDEEDPDNHVEDLQAQEPVSVELLQPLPEPIDELSFEDVYGAAGAEAGIYDDENEDEQGPQDDGWEEQQEVGDWEEQEDVE